MGAAGESSGRGLRVHASNRLEDLLERLVQTLCDDPLPPEVDEIVLVPSTSMARWLERQLASSRLGICASVEMPLLAPWFRSLLDPTPRRRAVDRVHALSPEVLTWRIHRLLGDARLAPQLQRPRRYFAQDAEGSKRLQLAQRIASCFDQYQLYRPELLQGWEASALATGHEDEPWQAALWRALVAEHRGAAAVPTLAQIRDRLRRGRPDAPLPRRVQTFGISAVPPLVLDLCTALGDHCPVDLYAFVPTQAYMDEQPRRRRATGETAQHPLLAELARQSRDFVQVLDERDSGGQLRVDLDRQPTTPRTLLQQVQAGIDEMAEPRGIGVIAAEDDSLRLHVAHSPFRELEILRDRVLRAMERDRSLKPNDVLVLITDLEAYAPAIHSVFGPLAELLPYQVQDRAPATERPFVKALVELFGLAASRWTNVEVLDLLANPCLRARFGLGEVKSAELQRWVQDAAIHWGIDADHRAAFGQPRSAEQTWLQGLDRLLLGTMTGPVEALVDGALPVAAHGQEVAARAGAFWWCVHELIAVHRALQQPRPLADWIAATRALLGRALAAPSPDDREDRKLVLDVLAMLERTCELAAHDEPASLRTWTDALTAALAARGASRHRGDCVTFASLRPMRMVPARVLAVCGLGDGFPRSSSPQPFDLLPLQPRRGDRNPRDDDRQLFLEALMSARDLLVLSYVGRSQRSNDRFAASPVLTELLESIDRGWSARDGKPRASRDVIREHPLQGFSRRHRADAPDLASYVAFTPSRGAPSDRFVPEGFAAPSSGAITACTIEDLLRFWLNPAKTFLQHALGIRLPWREGDLEETEPFARPSPRDDILTRLANAALADPEHAADALAQQGRLRRAAGELAPGQLAALDHANDSAAAELAAARARPRCGDRSILAVARIDDCTVTAWVQATDGRSQVLFAADRKEDTIQERTLLRAWLLHVICNVAAAAADDGAAIPTTTHVVTPSAGGCFRPLDRAVAEDCLRTLLQGYRAGHERPLPFAPRAAAQLARNPEQLQAAEEAFQPSNSGSRGRSRDPHVQMCWRGHDLLAPPWLDELRRLASEVWGPIQAHWEKNG